MVLLVTGGTFLLPIIAVWQLRSSGTVTSLWLLIVIAVAISMALSWLLKAYWTRGPHQSELLFSELLIWGWLWHLRRERQLANAARLLWTLDGAAPPGAGARLWPSSASRAERERSLRDLAEAVDAQDIYLHGHSRRVAQHAEMIGRRLGLSAPQLARLRTGALAHDVGKLMLPRSVLDKPGALTESEFELVKRHAEEGAKIVAPLGDREVTAIVRHHHERIDGRGYPWGLAGEEIPLGARIVAVADTFDAITSARPYRPAELHRQAIATLRECSGTQLDPEVVDAFLASYAGRRQAFVLAGLLAAPQQALARFAGGGSPRTTAANAAAIVAVSAAVAAAAGGSSPAASHQLSASRGKAAVLAAHVRRSARKATSQHSSHTSPSSRSQSSARSHKSGLHHSSGSGSGSTPANGGGSSPKTTSRGGSPSGPGSSGGKPPGRTTTGTNPGTGSGPGNGTPGTGSGPGNGTPGTGSPPTTTPGTGSPNPPGSTTTTTTSQQPPSQTTTTTSTTSTTTSSGGGFTPLSAGNTTCNGVYGGNGDRVTVPSGATCTLVPGTRADDVTVQPGGVLFAREVTVNHDLQADGTVSICGSTIEHDLHVENASGGGPIIVGGSCGGDTIGHDLHVENNAVPVTVTGNQVGHDLHVENNRAGSTVSGNRVGHDAHCQGDSPAATGSGNTAGHAQDCPA